MKPNENQSAYLMATTPPAAPHRSSPPDIVRKMGKADPHSTQSIVGTIPIRMTDVLFMEDDVTKKEMGKVVYNTTLVSGHRLVVTTLYTVTLDANNVTVEVEPSNPEVIGHHVVFYKPF